MQRYCSGVSEMGIRQRPLCGAARSVYIPFRCSHVLACALAWLQLAINSIA